MKKWAAVTVALYVALLAALTFPVLCLCFMPQAKAGELLSVFGEWVYWLILAVLGLAQGLLLLLPVDVSAGRPVPRRKVWLAVVTSAFLVAVLGVGGLVSIAMTVWGDHTPGDEWVALLVFLLAAAALWLAWGLVFFRFSRQAEAGALTTRLMRWLVRGSILELLVAVPCHVVTRSRGDCCAPLGTMFGIASGLAVMLAAFGPGVLFLFAKRLRDTSRPRP